MALRVLLADESSAIKKVFQLALQDYAAQVKSVHQGGDVSAIARDFQPDIIFTDILLQKRDGYEVSREIKEDPILGKTPVVLMWSGFLDFDEGKFKKSHADARLEKPFDVESLRKVVQKFVPKTQSQPLSAFLELPHIEFQEERPTTSSKSKESSAKGGGEPASWTPPPASSISVPTFEFSAEEISSGSSIELDEVHDGGGPEGLKIDFDFGTLSSQAPKFEDEPDKEHSEEHSEEHPEGLMSHPMGGALSGDEGQSSKEEITEIGDEPWTMESFDPIEDFAHKKLAEIPSEEFAQVSLSHLKRVEQVEDHSEEATREVDLFEEGRDERDEPTRAVDLFAEDLAEEVEESSKDTDGVGEEWKVQNLSQFRLDLPEGAESEEPQVHFVVPDEKISESDFLLHSPEQGDDSGRLKAEDRSISTHLDAFQPQLRREEIEEIVRQECRQIIESMVEKIVPQIAERLIQGELERLLREEENEAEL